MTSEITKPITFHGDEKLAENPQTPLALLQVLAEDDAWEVRWAVAKHPQTPLALLEVLAKDEEDENVRSAVAAHPQTPLAVLQVLAKDKHEDVRSAVAHRR